MAYYKIHCQTCRKEIPLPSVALSSFVTYDHFPKDFAITPVYEVVLDSRSPLTTASLNFSATSADISHGLSQIIPEIDRKQGIALPTNLTWAAWRVFLRAVMRGRCHARVMNKRIEKMLYYPGWRVHFIDPTLLIHSRKILVEKKIRDQHGETQGRQVQESIEQAFVLQDDSSGTTVPWFCWSCYQKAGENKPAHIFYPIIKSEHQIQTASDSGLSSARSEISSVPTTPSKSQQPPLASSTPIRGAPPINKRFTRIPTTNACCHCHNIINFITSLPKESDASFLRDITFDDVENLPVKGLRHIEKRDDNEQLANFINTALAQAPDVDFFLELGLSYDPLAVRTVKIGGKTFRGCPIENATELNFLLGKNNGVESLVFIQHLFDPNLVKIFHPSCFSFSNDDYRMYQAWFFYENMPDRSFLLLEQDPDFKDQIALIRQLLAEHSQSAIIDSSLLTSYTAEDEDIHSSPISGCRKDDTSSDYSARSNDENIPLLPRSEKNVEWNQIRYNPLRDLGIFTFAVTAIGLGAAGFFYRSQNNASMTTVPTTTVIPTFTPLNTTLPTISTYPSNTTSTTSSSTTKSTTNTTTVTWVTYDPTTPTTTTTTTTPTTTTTTTSITSPTTSTTTTPTTTFFTLPPAQVRIEAISSELKNTWAILRWYKRVPKHLSWGDAVGNMLVGEDHYRSGLSIKPFYGPFMPHEWQAFLSGLDKLCGENCDNHKTKILRILTQLDKGIIDKQCPSSWIFMRDIKPVSEILGSPNSLAGLIKNLIEQGAVLYQVS